MMIPETEKAEFEAWIDAHRQKMQKSRHLSEPSVC